MRRAIVFVIFVLATAGIVTAAYQAYQSRERGSAAASGGELLFAGLKARLNDTAAVKAVTPDGPMTLARQDGSWVVSERDGYRADQGKVQQLLLGLAELRRAEPKTSKPERYEQLGLQDPGSEGTSSRRFTVELADGSVAADVIVGNSRPARGAPNQSEIYVRLPDDPQTWMVTGSLPRTAGIIDWVDDTVLDMDAARIASVSVSHADGDAFSVRRTPGQHQGYTLDPVPAGREVDNHYVVRNVATGIASVPLDEVAAGDSLPGDGPPDLHIVLRTFDGLRIDMRARNDGDDMKKMVLSAAYEPGEDAGTEGTADDAIVRRPADEVQAEVERLNAAWKGWLYTVGNWRVATADKRSDEFLKAEAEETPAAAESAPTAGGSAEQVVAPAGQDGAPAGDGTATQSPATGRAAPESPAPAGPATGSQAAESQATEPLASETPAAGAGAGTDSSSPGAAAAAAPAQSSTPAQ